MVDVYMITFGSDKQLSVDARSEEGFDLKRSNIYLKKLPPEKSY